MDYLHLILISFIGLAIGSFLTAFTYRYPKGISFVKGRSFCPKCKTNIKWFDNLPFLSFLFLKGKCRFCKKKISFRYPLIEVVTATTFVLLYFFTGSFFQLLFFCFIYFIVASIVIIDLEEGLIPDKLVFIGFIVAFFYILFFENETNFQHLFAGFALSSFMLLVHLLTKGKGMGLGDVKFTLFPGTLLLFPFNILWLFVSFVSGAVLGVILILVGKAKFGKPIPFGPFLGVSFLIVLLWGQEIMKWLISIF